MRQYRRRRCRQGLGRGRDASDSGGLVRAERSEFKFPDKLGSGGTATLSRKSGLLSTDYRGRGIGIQNPQNPGVREFRLLVGMRAGIAKKIKCLCVG